MERTMNIYLSNLVHFYHKLQSYHWYVQGKTFFQSHAKLEEYYNFVNGQIDELAELMLMDGKKPVHASARLLKEKADDENDTLVSAKMDGFLEDYAKVLWMLRSTLA